MPAQEFQPRPFELQIRDKVAKRGRGAPRVGVWIVQHLMDVGEDYIFNMWKRYCAFLDWMGVKKKPSYQVFRNHIYMLRRLGVIEFTREEESKRPWLENRAYHKVRMKQVDENLISSFYIGYMVLKEQGKLPRVKRRKRRKKKKERKPKAPAPTPAKPAKPAKPEAVPPPEATAPPPPEVEEVPPAPEEKPPTRPSREIKIDDLVADWDEVTKFRAVGINWSLVDDLVEDFTGKVRGNPARKAYEVLVRSKKLQGKAVEALAVLLKHPEYQPEKVLKELVMRVLETGDREWLKVLYLYITVLFDYSDKHTEEMITKRVAEAIMNDPDIPDNLKSILVYTGPGDEALITLLVTLETMAS